jgi:hypothetical protein
MVIIILAFAMGDCVKSRGFIIARVPVQIRTGNILTNKQTNNLTPWNRVLLEKLRVPQLVKFPAFYGTRRFITAFTRARHLSLSLARSMQTMPLLPFLEDAF